jgi:DNA polymerase-3 subunit beta
VKAELSRKDLNDALTFASPAASTRSSLPILQTLRMEARDDGLTVLACDGEMWVERRVHAQVEKEGSVCAGAQVLLQVVAALPEAPVKLEAVDASLFVRVSGGEWRFPGLPTEDFPLAPEFKTQSELRLPMCELVEAIDAVAFAVADDLARPILTGVLFAYDGQVLTTVATDTHRLAVMRLPKEGIGSELNAVVPEKALRAVKNLPLAPQDLVHVQFDDQRLSVDAGHAKVVAQLLSGQFPNWERVVPQESTRSWTVDRNELAQNLRRALILARDSANRIRFTGQDELVVLAARSEERGEAKEELRMIGKNGDVEIAFNGRYIEDFVKAVKADGIRIDMTEPSRPAVFWPVDEEQRQFCVIMPMALG